MRSFAFSCAVALLAAAGSAHGQIINGGFELPGTGFQTVNNGQTFGNWTNAGPSNIEFVHAVFNPGLPNLQFSAYEGQYWIDLVGTGSPSGIYQDITGLDAGGLYHVSFAMAGNVWGGNFAFTMRVLWNGQNVGEFTQIHGGSDGTQMNWQLRSVDVVASVASGVNRLQFQAITGGNARGPALDAVSIAAIPAPGAAALLAGLGMFAGRRRR